LRPTINIRGHLFIWDWLAVNLHRPGLDAAGTGITA
jgi:hypothetical protein